MAFFDDLEKKLTKAGQSAVQKTKDFTEVNRIKGFITEEEKKIEAEYRNIGKLYFELHATTPEEALAEAVNNIRESAQKIIDYRTQMQEIRGVLRCEKCGAEIANNVAFCSSCGAPAPKPEPKEEPSKAFACKQCGSALEESARFCVNCGTPVVKEEPLNEPSVPTCTYCGKQVDPNARFCTSCGKERA